MRKMLGMLLLCCCLLLADPVSKATAYFAEDSYAPSWLEMKLPPVKKTTLKYYQVLQGDTLWSISNKRAIPLKTIAAVNGINENSVLYPGQMLVLPQVAGVLHRVEQGETLWSLSRRYHVSLTLLMTCNEITDPTQLTDGSELVVPQEAVLASRSSATASTQDNAPVSAPASAPPAETSAGGDSIKLGWPLKAAITSSFGPRNGGEYHHGLDIAGDEGDVIRAAVKGQVIFTGWMSSYGYTVRIAHGNDYQTLYGHVSKYLVNTGEQVLTGEPIARVGSSGHATGPHLHFEVRLHNRTIDPLPLLPH